MLRSQLDETSTRREEKELLHAATVAWQLTSTAVLAFLSLKGEMNSSRLLILHLTCYYLMRCRWHGGYPYSDQFWGGTSAIVMQVLMSIPAIKEDTINGVVTVMLRFATKRFGLDNFLRRFMAWDFTWNDMFYWVKARKLCSQNRRRPRRVLGLHPKGLVHSWERATTDVHSHQNCAPQQGEAFGTLPMYGGCAS
jgi:hypothetical protein